MTGKSHSRGTTKKQNRPPHVGEDGSVLHTIWRHLGLCGNQTRRFYFQKITRWCFQKSKKLQKEPEILSEGLNEKKQEKNVQTAELKTSKIRNSCENALKPFVTG